MNRSPNNCLVWCVAIAIGAMVTCLAGPLAADDVIRLERYLARLRLTDLQLKLQEDQLRSEPDAAKRNRLAAALGQAYVKRLLETAVQPARGDELAKRIGSLLTTYPATATPGLRVLLSQAEYQRAEAQAIAWLDDPAKTTARDAAVSSFVRLADELARIREALEKSIEEKMAKFDAIEDARGPAARTSATAATLEDELKLDQEVLNRARFFEGWSLLFRVLLEKEPRTDHAALLPALKTLGALLELSPEETSYEFDGESMQLESIWRARSLLGYMTALAAAGKPGLAKECLVPLRSAPDATVREGAFYWYLLALIRTQQWTEANLFAREQLAMATAETSAAHLPLAVLLVRLDWASADQDAKQPGLTRLGVVALAKMKKHDVLTALVAKYRPDPQPGDGFPTFWSKARLVFAEAEKQGSEQLYAAAAERYRVALALPDSADDSAGMAACEYSLAWCEYRLKRYASAARLFDKATTVMQTLRDDTAPQSAWMAFTSRQALHHETKRDDDAAAAEQSLQNLARDFSGTEQAKRADYLLAKIRANRARSGDWLQSLAAVPREAPHYLTARFDLAVARHRLWLEAAATDPQKETLARAARSEIGTYLQAAPASEGSRRVKATLMDVEIRFADREIDWTGIRGLLTKEHPLLDRFSPEDPLAAEFRYRQLQLAEHERNAKELREAMAWLREHAANSIWELPALVVYARGLEQQLAATSGEEKTKLRGELIDIYRQLIAKWGDDPATLQSKKNAAVSLGRLAKLESESGQFTAAAAKWEQLTAAFPQDATYHREAGRAWFQVREFEKSLSHWQKLTSGTPSGSAEWYEAKYYQLAAWRNVDRAAAIKAWKQFRVLHPQVTAKEWSEKFAALDRDFDTANTGNGSPIP